jgi:hypothetical protein
VPPTANVPEHAEISGAATGSDERDRAAERHDEPRVAPGRGAHGVNVELEPDHRDAFLSEWW